MCLNKKKKKPYIDIYIYLLYVQPENWMLKDAIILMYSLVIRIENTHQELFHYNTCIAKGS